MLLGKLLLNLSINLGVSKLKGSSNFSGIKSERNYQCLNLEAVNLIVMCLLGNAIFTENILAFQ